MRNLGGYIPGAYEGLKDFIDKFRVFRNNKAADGSLGGRSAVNQRRNAPALIQSERFVFHMEGRSCKEKMRYVKNLCM